MSRRYRVLLDLSLTTEGFSGIPQVTRLLFRMLRQMPEVDVTGLMYCPRGTTSEHRFSQSPVRGERIGNQALFLEALTSREPPLSTHRLLRHGQRLNRFLHFLVGPTRCQEMETSAFWDVLWRNYFYQTLGPEDIDIVKSGRFLLSTFSNRAMNYRWKLGLPAQKLDTRGYDFVIFQDSRIARVAPETTPIVRYHDMIPLLRPDCLTARRTIQLHHAALRWAVRDSAFVCNTDNTERDLLTAYPQVKDRCCVIPYPLSSAYYPQRDEELLATILQARRNDLFGEGPTMPAAPGPYILSVSTLEPRKNYASLVQAFSRLNARHKSAVKLVVVGARGWKWEGLESHFRPLIESGQLIHLSNVSHEEMRVLYSHASALAFVSYYEGFGLAPVEAMQCETPVVLSDASSHRDVAGDAALYCNPYDVDSIRDALGQLLFAPDSAQLRQSLIARGRQQLRRYQQSLLQDRWLELFHKLRPELAPATIPISAGRRRQAA